MKEYLDYKHICYTIEDLYEVLNDSIMFHKSIRKRLLTLVNMELDFKVNSKQNINQVFVDINGIIELGLIFTILQANIENVSTIMYMSNNQEFDEVHIPMSIYKEEGIKTKLKDFV